MYESKATMENGIESVKTNAADATIKEELELVIIQLEDDKERLIRIVRELEAEVQRLGQIARY
jgi:hypothetical protein